MPFMHFSATQVTELLISAIQMIFVAFSPQSKYTDRATATAGELNETFAGIGCGLVNAAGSYDR
jgi:hypothetical protein